jgi:hypothetical protein
VPNPSFPYFFCPASKAVEPTRNPVVSQAESLPIVWLLHSFQTTFYRDRSVLRYEEHTAGTSRERLASERGLTYAGSPAEQSADEKLSHVLPNELSADH